jgi:hypothetical protein
VRKKRTKREEGKRERDKEGKRETMFRSILVTLVTNMDLKRQKKLLFSRLLPLCLRGLSPPFPPLLSPLFFFFFSKARRKQNNAPSSEHPASPPELGAGAAGRR